MFKEFIDSSVRSTYFCERVINIWNRLPSQTVDFSFLSIDFESLSKYGNGVRCASLFLFAVLFFCYLVASIGPDSLPDSHA